MKTLAIIGAGHLGQQIAHYAIGDRHYADIVFFDDVSKEKEVGGFPVLGGTDRIEDQFSEGKFDELIIGIGYKHLPVRKGLYERFNGKVPFGKIVHSSCWVDETAVVHSGSVIYPSCIIDAHATIGRNSILNLGCCISHDTTVGAHCFLSPRVAVAGFVNIGEQCIIGINATLIDNISITDRTQIGGGAVVIKSINNTGLHVGNPSKFIR